jgi:hypothetical protein
MVSASDASAILAEPKVLAANLVWKWERGMYRLEATVLAMDSGQALSLRGCVGLKNRSFVLLYNNTPILKYTAHSRHRDPVTRQFILQPHKHPWDDEWQDQLVFIPNDIRVGDPNNELVDFLQECNIELRGSYGIKAFFMDSMGGTP